MMKKGKALLAVGLNLKTLGKVPGFIKTSIEGFKGDLEELKTAISTLKTTLPTISSSGSKCAADGITNPLECYKLIHGPIRYTQEQRAEWE